MKWLTGWLLFAACLHATEEAPWIDRVLQPVGYMSATYQHFSKIHNGHHYCSYPGRDALLEAGLFFACSPEFSGELEVSVTRTHAHSWAIDRFKQTVRYMLSDDAQGDCFASSVGISLSQPMKIALHDPSFIHHALFEVEVHAAIGREWSCGPDWVYRLYGLAALGIGNSGSPWLRGKVCFLKNFSNTHYLFFCFEGEKGFGGRSLSLHHFHGYGPIDYAIIDGSINYSYQSECGWIASLSFLQRLYSQNAPWKVSQIKAELIYPF